MVSSKKQKTIPARLAFVKMKTIKWHLDHKESIIIKETNGLLSEKEKMKNNGLLSAVLMC